MTIHNISDDVLFLNNPNQTQTQQQRQSQTSTPDVALQSQMISHRMQATSATSGLHTPGGTTASTPSNQSHLRSSYHQHQPPRSQVSSVRLSNISSGGSSDLDSREYFMFKLRYYQSRERKFSCAKKKLDQQLQNCTKLGPFYRYMFVLLNFLWNFVWGMRVQVLVLEELTKEKI